MKTNRFQRSLASLFLLSTAAAGCASGQDVDPTDTPEPAPAAQAAERTTGAALKIEQAERQLDMAGDISGARASLLEVLADPAISGEERDQATLALSRAHEASGDKKAAVSVVEELLASHAKDEGWQLEKAAESRLRKLLTGSETGPKSVHFEDAAVAPIAHALAKHFKPIEDGKKIRGSMVMFNARRGVSERLGTFNIGGALRKKQMEICPLCEDDLSVGRDETRFGSWVEIPAAKRLMGDALVVFYFDLEGGRVPAHYDELLPMPSAEVVARLERGEGVIAVKMRDDAPPVLLLGAPRLAQLSEVEAAFAAMEELPTTPATVRVSQSLAKEEIQQGVRGARKAMQSCYEGLLASKPQAAGKIHVKFAALPAGNVADVAVEADRDLDDSGFVGCIRSTFEGISFPKTQQKTTVTYPLEFAP